MHLPHNWPAHQLAQYKSTITLQVSACCWGGIYGKAVGQKQRHWIYLNPMVAAAIENIQQSQTFSQMK